ncbi:tetratricopeptide repeat protein [Novosphingobium sp. PhB165]|uniref:tetratricopeptide repeat-containing sulfotransferase family protein n=1 Tax=Novosphingobium sp. PhB165 TaxID=2485105 RepID=UPI00104A01C0|nr:tetratricopeptide repeat-containing sulfotransferase family protein [Novosphingobium sp. PhB165]TCM19440.1 tetratricopeptide repeat protein [Novosphingobium sp. PhB165]
MTSSTPSEQLNQIAGLARIGRLDEAAVMAASATAVHPQDATLAALGGAVEFHRRQYDRAATYLERAHAMRPQDLVVRTNLVESYLHLGRNTQALALCDEAAALAEPSLRLAGMAAHLAQEAEDFPLASRLYRHVLAKRPDDWSLLNNLGNTLRQMGEGEEAVKLLQRAAKLAPDAPPIRVNLGNALFGTGRGEEGEQVLRDAARDFPDDHVPMLTLANYYREVGLLDRYYEALAEAARRAPDNAGLQSDYGTEAARQGHFDLAEARLEASLALEPALGPSFVGLAAVYERANREAELDSLAERAAAAGVDDPSRAYIDALRFKRAERFEDAFAALELSTEVVQSDRVAQVRGILFDRMGQPDEAFAAFAEMNAINLEQPSQPGVLARLHREGVARDSALLTPEWAAGWSASPSSDRPAPVFLLGFPRSGTTLLDTMLMTAPDTLVLEEEDIIGQIEHELGGMEVLPSLDEEAIRAARARYFERVAGFGPLGPETMVIDKHPLHLNQVPTILRLFPDAKFVLALRHPCDVLLSCFITNFRTNPAMSNFLALDTAAEFYDMSFAYWTKARAIFDMSVRTVVYERLVADQARELEPLFDWLGLPWQGEDFDHRDAARARGVVRTASYAQVTEAVYTRAAGRWRRYERHLASVFPTLKPWVEGFGYALDDDRVPPWDEPSGSTRR